MIAVSAISTLFLLPPFPAAAAIPFGIGHSNTTEPEQAGEIAAATAKEGLQDTVSKLVLVFDRLDGVAKHFDKSLIHGCTARSPLTTDTNDCMVAVLALAGDIEAKSAVAGIGDGHEQCGQDIARQLKKQPSEGNAKLMIVMGSCTVPKNGELVRGIKAVMGEDLPLLGGAASGGEFVYCRGTVHKASNAGLLLSGNFRFLTASATAPERTPETVIAAAARAASDVRAKAAKKAPLALVFNCAGRFGELKNRHPEELAALRKLLRPTQLFGYYGNGEIGPRPGKTGSEGLAHHVVICLVTD
jgi:hypothetical protein